MQMESTQMNARFNSRGSNFALVIDGQIVARFNTRGEAKAEQIRRHRLFGVWGFVQAIV
jgi:hypothetical protein